MLQVIIIDDDESFGILAARWLERGGVRARFHKGPFGTLNALSETRCKLVILDVNMPGLRGERVLRLIRETAGLGRPKIILCSRMDDGALKSLAQKMGADGYVTKGVAQEDFVIKVKGYLPASDE